MENMDKSQGIDSGTDEPEMDVRGALDRSIERSREFLLSCQDDEGFWVDELEANVTISAELIFFMHFTDRLDPVKQDQIVNYLLQLQREDGSWPPFLRWPV